ncbi:MAG: T9SS C-terminal target domain-containing protein [Calditrichaeota bacterium]|nr:MAG: T9SS C-terminal target domain-containing protein [Calditrichota bacterium]MBL1203865.1 T9SS C-terminal target domain-containing protein [Calditrichota bacterium]NOG43697.1 S8 family serine peptidase [Calditrichota bacterium]
MFKNILILLFLFFQIAFSGEYFVHLSDEGLKHKNKLLNENLSFLSSTNINFAKNNQFTFKEINSSYLLNSNLQNWIILETETEETNFIQSLKDDHIIEYYEPIGRFKIDFESSDSLSGQQWYLDKIDVKGAWQITQGKPDIIVGVIDTGIDYLHPDLIESLWINSQEDLNGNGQLDEDDLNNIDDDGNGFVDDVIGWDFTDAPRFADGGDFQDPDNEPMDEFGTGHGTQVAGIISAKANNVTGIAGVAPGVKVMNLRAGTASGYLEEDDVARAILYAVENGARIINMSFGDTALSRFLRDIIHFANEQDVIIVASAGNSATDQVHYPSGLIETISVGASTEDDGLAGFSNFGNTIDLVAPGSDILSTAVGGSYNSVNGTSFSAPIVSAVSALLLSNNPDISSDQIRNILKSSAQDILFLGWDNYSGAGRVSASHALNIPHGGVLEVTSPLQNFSTADQKIAIIGSAAHPDLVKSTIEYGIGKSPEQWSTLRNLEGRQIIDDTLAVLNSAAISDTIVTIKITMELFNFLSDEIHTSFLIDRTEPQISNISTTPLWDGATASLLVSFETDDICTAQLNLRPLGSSEPFITMASPYETQNQRIKIDKNQFDGEFEFFIEVKNLSGLKSRDDNLGQNYNISLDRNFSWKEFNKVEWQLPAGYMLDKVMDFDHDGKKEVVISRYDENSAFGPIEIYEFENGIFELRLKTGFTAIPRAAGDVDSDGKTDLLLGLGQFSFLLEAKDANSFPTELIWQDTTNFWAAAYTDLDNDGKNEITGRIENEYVLLENISDNSFSEIARLTNNGEGQNRLGVPKVELSDLTGDAVDDIVFGDYDGELLVFTTIGDNQFDLVSTGKTVHTNSTEMISSDGLGTIFTATHTSDDLNFEHEFDARYWSIEFFENHSGSLISKDTINTFGFSATKDFDSGLKYHVFDGRELLFAPFFPELFVFEKSGNQWLPVWFNEQARSNTVLVADLDGDGNDEFYFNDGTQIVGYSSARENRPIAPYIFSARALDSTRVSLQWSAVEDADYFNIYRGSVSDNLSLFTNTSKTFYIDSSSITGQKYFYKITTVDSSFEIRESFFSTLDSAQTAYPPKPESVEFSNEKQLLITFDQPVFLFEEQPFLVKLTNRNDVASSVINDNSGKSLLVSFDDPFVENEPDTLELHNIFGQSGVPVDNNFNKIAINYVAEFSAPYVTESSWFSETQMKIEFSEAMQIPRETSFSFPIEPSGETEKVEFDSLGNSMIVTLGKKSFIGASGQKSYLIIINLYSQNGVLLEETSAISLFRESENLDKVIVYPQPLKPRHNELIFANLPGDVIIQIYSINGSSVRKIEEQTSYGGVKWDLKDSSGKKVSAGLYIYTLEWNGKVIRGKLAIIK